VTDSSSYGGVAGWLFGHPFTDNELRVCLHRETADDKAWCIANCDRIRTETETAGGEVQLHGSDVQSNPIHVFFPSSWQ